MLCPVLLSLIFGFGGCAATAPQPPPPGLVGTWRWVSTDGRKIEAPFYIKFYADNQLLTWPNRQNGGITHGKYSVQGGDLILAPGHGAPHPKAHLQIAGNEMILISAENQRLVYRRAGEEPPRGAAGR
jgi:hypothetical protein